MKKRKFLLLFCLLAFCPLLGWTQVNTLIVENRGGQTTAFALASSPVVTCDNGQLTVVSSDADLCLQLSDVESYYFENGSTSCVEDVQLLRPTVTVANGRIRVEGLQVDDCLAVFTIDGKCISATKADAGGIAIVDNVQGMGVVIVKTPRMSFKIQLKSK